MSQTQALSVSIIIPVFNEEDYIGRCLDSIQKQTVKPLEIIIVDNNCTDQTIPIAMKYPGVRVVKEPVQGRTVSRNRGFNTARGDILGRIDADSILNPDWVERVAVDFKDPAVGAVTGLGRTKVAPFLSLYSTLWARVYYMSIQSLHGIISTWGADMAVRRTVWEEVKDDTAPNGLLVHEDQDVAYVVIGHHYRVELDSKLLITTHGGSMLYWPKFWDYTKKTFRMKKHHDRKGTLADVGKLKLGMPRRIAQGIICVPAWSIFAVYSLLAWPIFQILHHVDSDKIKEYR